MPKGLDTFDKLAGAALRHSLNLDMIWQLPVTQKRKALHLFVLHIMRQ